VGGAFRGDLGGGKKSRGFRVHEKVLGGREGESKVTYFVAKLRKGNSGEKGTGGGGFTKRRLRRQSMGGPKKGMGGGWGRSEFQRRGGGVWLTVSDLGKKAKKGASKKGGRRSRWA